MTPPDTSFEAKLGHTFTNRSLLVQALTHRSCSPINYERMEFIGDSILNTAAAVMLFDQFPNHQEGVLSHVRTALVRQDTLVLIAEELGLPPHIRKDSGWVQLNRDREPSIVADVLEAVFGAIFLDAGMERALAVIKKHLAWASHSGAVTFKKDSKTSLQEHLQARGIALPTYAMLDRNRTTNTVKASCAIPGLRILTTGVGSTRKLAESQAAAEALALCKKP